MKNKKPNNSRFSDEGNVAEKLSDDGAYTPVKAEIVPPASNNVVPKSVKEASVLKIQKIARKLIAIKRMRKRSEKLWERVFDPRFKRYFWFNKGNGKSQWTVPILLRLHDERDHAAAIQMQKIVRGFLDRMRTRQKV